MGKKKSESLDSGEKVPERRMEKQGKFHPGAKSESTKGLYLLGGIMEAKGICLHELGSKFRTERNAGEGIRNAAEGNSR